MSFLETQFPTDVSFGSAGGPEFITEIVPYGAGNEQRNIRLSTGMHSFNAAYGAKTQSQIESVINFFHAVRGMAYGFRYQDPLDYKSCAIADEPAFDDQTIGTGDGSETEFQLIKTYTEGSLSEARDIKKPVIDTVLIGINGVNQSSGWTVDTTTGLITFSVAPTNTHAVTAGYQFDVPCRFGVDRLQISIDNRNHAAGYIVNADIPVQEIAV